MAFGVFPVSERLELSRVDAARLLDLLHMCGCKIETWMRQRTESEVQRTLPPEPRGGVRHPMIS